ncbi:hypothetical protein FACS1894158_18680 [Betaproteobacteria bacterium]|nr:hypothetical protein FACS1894158_18680 [Betaproteobacteria bacterium]
MMLNFFSTKRPDHPLGDAKEFKRVLAGLPQDELKAIDEIYVWFESLRQSGDFRLDHLHEVVSGLDEAAQAFLRQLARRYLQTPRLSKNDEMCLWTMCFNYWGEVSWLYASCLERFRKNPKDKGSEAFKKNFPLVATRLMAARANQIKWINYRYGVIGADLWHGLGLPYLAAEAEGYAQKSVQIYPGSSERSSVELQYLKVLVRESSSMGMLLPLEIELADRLIVHFLPSFVFGKENQPGSMYWVDPSIDLPPTRLVQAPAQPSPDRRFFQPGAAFQELDELMRVIERGSIPGKLNLGTEYPAAELLKVLQHLALYWAPASPKREHVRHAVKSRMAVLQGFDNSLSVFAGHVSRLGVERLAESWVVEDVSLGGFRAGMDEVGDWLAIGSLLCLQPEGGDNWVLGVVRRRSVGPDSRANIGIQTLSRNPQSLELRPRTSGLSATEAIPGILLHGDKTKEQIRLVLPPGGFNVRNILEYVDEEDRRYLLSPMELEESGKGFEIGVYRKLLAA